MIPKGCNLSDKEKLEVILHGKCFLPSDNDPPRDINTCTKCSLCVWTFGLPPRIGLQNGFKFLYMGEVKDVT